MVQQQLILLAFNVGDNFLFHYCVAGKDFLFYCSIVSVSEVLLVPLYLDVFFSLVWFFVMLVRAKVGNKNGSVPRWTPFDLSAEVCSLCVEAVEAHVCLIGTLNSC